MQAENARSMEEETHEALVMIMSLENNYNSVISSSVFGSLAIMNKTFTDTSLHLEQCLEKYGFKTIAVLLDYVILALQVLAHFVYKVTEGYIDYIKDHLYFVYKAMCSA